MQTKSNARDKTLQKALYAYSSHCKSKQRANYINWISLFDYNERHILNKYCCWIISEAWQQREINLSPGAVEGDQSVAEGGFQNRRGNVVRFVSQWIISTSEDHNVTEFIVDSMHESRLQGSHNYYVYQVRY